MPVSDTRLTVLEIINAVEKKLGLNASASLTASTFTEVLLGLLNEVVDELADDGNWLEQRGTVTVTAASSVREYAIPSDSSAYAIHSIYEVVVSGRVSPLQPRSYSVIKQLSRNNSFGKPNQWAPVSVNASADPVIEVFPCPGSAEAGNLFTVHILKKPRLYTTSDASVVPPFPAMTLIGGLHSRAQLEESGQEPTGQGRATFQLHERQKGQAINRYTTDTGPSVQFRPRR